MHAQRAVPALGRWLTVRKPRLANPDPQLPCVCAPQRPDVCCAGGVCPGQLRARHQLQCAPLPGARQHQLDGAVDALGPGTWMSLARWVATCWVAPQPCLLASSLRQIPCRSPQILWPVLPACLPCVPAAAHAAGPVCHPLSGAGHCLPHRSADWRADQPVHSRVQRLVACVGGRARWPLLPLELRLADVCRCEHGRLRNSSCYARCACYARRRDQQPVLAVVLRRRRRGFQVSEGDPGRRVARLRGPTLPPSTTRRALTDRVASGVPAWQGEAGACCSGPFLHAAAGMPLLQACSPPSSP